MFEEVDTTGEESSRTEESSAVVNEVQAPSDSAATEPQVEGESPTLSVRHPDNPDMRWYAVQTYSGYEEKTRKNMLDQISRSRYQDKFGEIFVPTTTSESVTKTGKKRVVTRVLFPGYMIIQMEMNDNTMMVIKDTPRVSGFIGNQRLPRPLPDNEVMRLISTDSETSTEEAVVSDVMFQKGEALKVIDGPFSNFDGVVEEVMPDKARLRVLVSIFGRETPVDLEYKQVEKLD